MPQIAAISNVTGALGATAQTDTQVTAECVNNSGGTLLPGDVVIIDVTGILANTTTTANNPSVLGVVLPSGGGVRTVTTAETVASGASMLVCLRGVARVNIAANSVTAGTGGSGGLATSAAAKVAAQPAAAASVAAFQTLAPALFATPLEDSSAKDANNTIRCRIF